MTTTFTALGLADPLLRAVAALGFESPTSVQEQAIPAAMKGGDWMVSSQTGSGKTAAFLIPVFERLLNSPDATALVLCPTRELAQQVTADAIGLVKFARIRVGCVVGGMPYGKQLAQLRGARLVVATPGRLLDLANSRQIRIDTVRCLVVDEADRMLDLGFAEDLEAIHKHCDQREQTLMYSATFAPRIMQLASRLMREPGRLELATAQDVHQDIAQTLHWADGLAHKKKLLEHWLKQPGMDQAVVFASTQTDAEDLADELAAAGHAVAALHGGMPQTVRNRRLKSLRDGRVKILVATDVAARGLDVPTISHVINFGLPMKADDYVHRIGRTGRAGRSGTAVTLAEHRDRARIRAIEAFTSQRIVASVVPGLEPRVSAAPSTPRNNKRPANGRPSQPREGFAGQRQGREFQGAREQTVRTGGQGNRGTYGERDVQPVETVRDDNFGNRENYVGQTTQRDGYRGGQSRGAAAQPREANSRGGYARDGQARQGYGRSGDGQGRSQQPRQHSERRPSGDARASRTGGNRGR